MSFKPARGKGFLEEFEQLSKADGEFVDVGWFEEQGSHPTAIGSDGSPMSYVELANFHATGGGGQVPIRDVLAVASDTLSFNQMNRLEKAMEAWLEDPSKGVKESLLPLLGEQLTMHIMDVFGSALLHPTAGNPDPLIDSGELMRNTSYKVKGRSVRKGVL